MARDFTKNTGNTMTLANGIGSVLNGAGAMSAACWANVDTIGSGASDNALFSIVIGSGLTGFGFRINGSGATKVFRIAARSNSGESAQLADATSSFSTGTWHHCGGVVQISGTDAILPYFNGTQEGGGSIFFGSSSYTHSYSSGTNYIGAAHSLSTSTQTDGRIAELALWNVALSAADFAALAKGASPLCIKPESLVLYFPLRGQGSSEPDLISGYTGTITGTVAKADHPRIIYPQRKRRIFLPSGTSYSLTAGYGAFSLNGQAASLLANRRVTADYGAFSLNGQAASLLANRRVAADYGAFSLNGQAASLLANRRVTADYGSFALNGQDANFLRGRTLTADYGSFALNGQVASLLATRRVTADYGVFSLNGQDANFMRGRTLVATYGSFALAGQDAGLLATRRVAADYGNFALNGQTAGLFLGRRVTADYGAFSLTGQAASLLTARRVAADYGSFALNGQAATLTWSGYEETIVQIVIHGMSLARDVTIAGMNLSRDVTIDGTDLSRDITIAIDPWN